MKRTALTLLLISWLAVTTLTTIELTSLTKANPSPFAPIEHAFIRSNGDIDPSTLPIERMGNVYFLKDNILNYSIQIQKNDIILCGNGFTLTSNKTDAPILSGYPSIKISNNNNIIIENIRFSKCYTGIKIINASNITIFGNTIENSEKGIEISSSINCSIINNSLINNSETGLLALDSTYFNVSYNTISRNHFHGGWIALNYSTISKNSITDNSFNHFGNGLYLYGPNCNNRIFENNFINNEIGILYQGPKGISANNTVFNNYWSNYQDAIVNVGADAASAVDHSPLSSPISTSFDSSLFPLPSLKPIVSPTPNDSDSEPFPTTLVVAVSVASLAAVGVGLLVYFKKRKRWEKVSDKKSGYSG